MNDNSQKATDFVAAWVASRREQIGGTQLKFIQQDAHGRTFCAEFETAKHLIQFCAWDHGSCLDILALDKATGANAYVVSGECNGTAGLSQKLHGFLSWLTIHDSGHAT